jgi:molybdopterin molybdotransferase
VSAGTPRSGHLDLCYQDDPELLPAAEAMRRIHAHVPLIEDREQVALDDALERILGEDVIAPRDVPGHTNSAVDGYALAGAVLPREGEASVRIAGTALAGAPHAGAVGAGECVRIMTGAVMPEGTDTVVMQEHVSVTGEQVRIAAGHRAGQNVRRAGEDLRAGQVMLAAGTRLLPAALGMLASVGIAQVCVRRRVKVAFFSTGDELRSLGEALAPGQVYDSNRYTLRGMLTRLGVDFVDLGVVRDDPVLLREAIDAACAAADVVLTSGGVSTGEADYVKGILEQRGQVGFWRIAVRPGRPLAFGRLGEAVFFGLPGNPVSVMATFYQFVQPALRGMTGESQTPAPTLWLTTETPLKKAAGRTDFQRGRLVRGTDGQWRVNSTGLQGSHVLTSMSHADCFIILPADNAGVAAGELVEVQPFAGLF